MGGEVHEGVQYPNYRAQGGSGFLTLSGCAVEANLLCESRFRVI